MSYETYKAAPKDLSFTHDDGTVVRYEKKPATADTLPDDDMRTVVGAEKG